MNESDLELYGIVGKMFREIRENKGLSLEAGAEYLNIAPKSLQRYECGERKIKIGTIKELCNFYKINYDDFIVEAKLRFGKNIYASNAQKEKTPKIIQYYEMLNDVGKHEATKRVKELTELPRYVQEDTTYYVNAAHADDYANAPEELKQQEENIMDNEF